MLLQPLDAEELRAQDLVTIPGRERRTAPDGATQGIGGPVPLELPGRCRWGQGCDLAIRTDRTPAHRWGAIRRGIFRDARAQAFPSRLQGTHARRENRRRTDLTRGSPSVRQVNTSSGALRGRRACSGSARSRLRAPARGWKVAASRQCNQSQVLPVHDGLLSENGRAAFVFPGSQPCRLADCLSVMVRGASCSRRFSLGGRRRRRGRRSCIAPEAQ